MGKIKDITGKKFGRLTAIKFDHRNNTKYYWLFRCDCGKEKVLSTSNIIWGDVKSCGCLLRQQQEEWHTHGMSKTRFWSLWKSMKRRCLSKNINTYKYYGARGIKVCDRWEKFENFRDDMYQSYLEHVKDFGESETTLDRRDNNEGYNKENCRWVTNNEQYSNRRNRKTIMIDYNGKIQNLNVWKKELLKYVINVKH